MGPTSTSRSLRKAPRSEALLLHVAQECLACEYIWSMQGVTENRKPDWRHLKVQAAHVLACIRFMSRWMMQQGMPASLSMALVAEALGWQHREPSQLCHSASTPKALPQPCALMHAALAGWRS